MLTRRKLVLAIGLVAPAVVACGGGAPLATPTLAPSPSVIASPSVIPSTTAVATVQPSPPSASPVGAFLGTDILLYSDDLDDPTTGWPTGDGGTYGVAYEDGALSMYANGVGTRVANGKELGGAFQAVRFAGLFEIDPGSTGITGLHCLDGDGDVFGGGVGTDGTYFLYRQGDVGGLEIVARETADSATWTQAGDPVMIMVECAVHPDGSAEIYLSVNGSMLLHQTETGSALDDMTTIGIFMEAEGETLAVRLTEAAAWVGGLPATATPTPAPSATPGSADSGLLDHVPSDIATTCDPLSRGSYAPGQIDGVICSGDVVEEVVYSLFDGTTSMNAEFEDRAAAYAENAVENGDCTDGYAARGGHTIGGEPAGDYVCYVYFGSSVLEWTTTSLNILASAATSGDSVSLWDWWETAGPDS